MMETITDVQRLQRYQMALFYFSTNGPAWMNSTGWLTSTDECSWYMDSPACGNGQDWDKLDMSMNNLAGELPEELRFVREIINRAGSLQGKLVSFNESVKEIIITGSKFTEPMDNDFFSEMQDLQVFVADNNNIRGQVPPLDSLLELRVLSMAQNFLTGTFPSLGSNLTHVVMLNFTNNLIRGPIPSSPVSLEGLKILDVSSNAFTGTIPFEIATSPTIEFFLANFNVLGGPVPQFYDKRLVRLDDNFFEGTIPCESTTVTEMWADCVQDVICTHLPFVMLRPRYSANGLCL